MTTDAVYGATKVSWKKANPRQLLKQIVDTGAHGNELLERFWQAIQSKEDVLKVVVEYYVANNERSLRTYNLPRGAETKVATESMAKAMVTKAKDSFLKSLIINGKALGKHTFGECLAIGGSLTAIGNAGPANSLVETILSDEQARELWEVVN